MLALLVALHEKHQEGSLSSHMEKTKQDIGFIPDSKEYPIWKKTWNEIVHPHLNNNMQ